MWLALDAVKKGEADVVGLRRQYRRADGDGAFQSQDDRGHRAPGDRGAVADAQGRVGGARRRRLDRRRRAASDQPRRHGQRHGARAVRHRAADRRSAQYRGRGGQGPRAGARGRPAVARRPFPAFQLRRLCRGRRHRQRHGRRGGDRRLCRQYRVENRGRHRPPVRAISQERHEPDLGGAPRLSAVAPGVPHAARQDGPAQIQRRRVSRPQRHRHQEPWRRRRRGLRVRDRHGLRHVPLRIARQNRRVDGARFAGKRDGAQWRAERSRDGNAFGGAGLRQLSARADPQQR